MRLCQKYPKRLCGVAARTRNLTLGAVIIIALVIVIIPISEHLLRDRHEAGISPKLSPLTTGGAGRESFWLAPARALSGPQFPHLSVQGDHRFWGTFQS